MRKIRQPAVAERARDSISGVSRHGIGIEEACDLNRRYGGGDTEPIIADSILLWSSLGRMSESAIDEGGDYGYEGFIFIRFPLQLGQCHEDLDCREISGSLLMLVWKSIVRDSRDMQVPSNSGYESLSIIGQPRTALSLGSFLLVTACAYRRDKLSISGKLFNICVKGVKDSFPCQVRTRTIVHRSVFRL